MKVITPAFRVSYPNVFKAKVNTLSGKEEYSLTALFPKDADLGELRKAAEEACVKKWGADRKKWPKNLRSPFRDQAERSKEQDDGVARLPDGYIAGAKFIAMKCYKAPGIVDQKRQAILAEDEFYAGCWARASITAFAYDHAGNRGISFWLNNLQKVKDDDSFSGRPKAEDEFSAIDSDASESSTDDFLG